MKLTLEISDRGCIVQHAGANGDLVVKAVDVGDLARAFAGDVIMDTGWLGPRVHRYAQMGGVTRLLIEDPPQRRAIRYERTTVENVPTPRCLFHVSLQNGQVQGVRMVVCAEHVPPGMGWIPTDASPVAKVPFPNVFQDTRICWGHAVIPVVTIPTIAGLVNLFWGAPFNHDLERYGLPPTWRGHATPVGTELLNRLAAEPIFPADLLVRIGTLGNWWRGDVER
jgi:hypothetical protein